VIGGIITKLLGVIGGLGPWATAWFMELVVKMTDARRDSEHIPMIIYNKPDIPDRTSYIVGRSNESPLEPIITVGRFLAEQGADYIAIPCVTSYFFYEQLQEGIRAPIIDMVYETAVYLKDNKVKKVGIMATDGTILGGFFTGGLENCGISVVQPSREGQELLMDIIYGGIKAGNPFNINDFYKVEEELRYSGAEIIILGCTELSLIKRNYNLNKGFLDATEVLARKAVLLCSGRLKSEYVYL
jgi:aspartate racemase